MDRISFNTITNYYLDMESVLKLYHNFGISNATLWREKIDPIGVNHTKRLLENYGISVTGICGWYDRPKSSITLQEKKRSIEIAAELNSPTVTILAPCLDGFEGSLEDCRKVSFEQTALLLDTARECQVKLVIEPVHPKLLNSVSCLNTLDQAIEWCEKLGPGVGIELDVNNLWWDPWLYKQMRVAANKNLICGVQLSDVSNDGSQERVIMGKGVFNIEDFVCFLNELGYSGMFEVELIGKSLWMRDSHQYMKEIIKSCAHLLG
ncbi:MAG: sugar phosphate isomerase/epimerase [Paracoccaceae bacterium]|nr:sugar phosphate isomerase/epimerase [Paracoccaceae bacterium]